MAERAFHVARLPGFATTAIIVFVALYLPIFTLVAYSFNASTSLAVWGGFSLDWYAKAWDNQQVRDATIRSLIIASFAAVIATTVATMAALGIRKMNHSVIHEATPQILGRVRKVEHLVQVQEVEQA